MKQYTFPLLLLLIMGCSSEKIVNRTLLPTITPGTQIPNNRIHTIREKEYVDVWYLGRYVDASGNGMYEKGKFYQITKDTDWNLEPNQEYTNYNQNLDELYNKAFLESTSLKQKMILKKLNESKTTDNNLSLELESLKEKQISLTNEQKRIIDTNKVQENKIQVMDDNMNTLSTRDNEIIKKIHSHKQYYDEKKAYSEQNIKDVSKKISALKSDIKKNEKLSNRLKEKQKELEKQLHRYNSMRNMKGKEGRKKIKGGGQ